MRIVLEYSGEFLQNSLNQCDLNIFQCHAIDMVCV